MISDILKIDNKLNSIALLFLASCASIMSPPGGAKDETPPELISTTPENKTTNYEGSHVDLVFSEYIDENSIKNAISILPSIKNKPLIKYKGKKIQILFEQPLEKNQTYIIVVNRNLCDERNVKLAQGIQFAFSTGLKIDDGSISGKIFNSKTSSVQLWKIKDKNDSLNFYKRIPDYSIDASDSGYYEFQFLSPAEYRILALDHSLSGLAIVPDNMLFGLHWEPLIRLNKQLNQEDINIYLPTEKNKIKMLQAQWIEGSWGTITFSKDLEDYFRPDLIDILYEDSVKAKVRFFKDNSDNKKINFILDTLINSPVIIETKEESNEYSFFHPGKIRIMMDKFVDTTKISIKNPKKNEKLKIEEQKIVPLIITFSSIIDVEKSNSNFFLTRDSINVDFDFEWINPLSVKIYPRKNWHPNTKYNFNVPQESISSFYKDFLSDSVLNIPFKTSEYSKFGSITIKPDKRFPKNLKIELSMLEGGDNFYRRGLNSDMLFELDNIVEGPYSLMFFQDLNKDNQISSGSLDPYDPSEWFYYYPDTIMIRSNWELVLDEITLGREF